MAKKTSGGLIRAALDFLRKNRRRGGDTDRVRGDRLHHVIHGDVHRDRGYGTGYHHRPGDQDLPDRRIGPVEASHPNGVYDARPEYFDQGPPPVWLPKKYNAKNTFFPDSWSANDIDDGISEAFKNGVKHSDGKWYGEHNGVYISGYYDSATGRIDNGFPVSPTRYDEAREALGK